MGMALVVGPLKKEPFSSFPRTITFSSLQYFYQDGYSDTPAHASIKGRTPYQLALDLYKCI